MSIDCLDLDLAHLILFMKGHKMNLEFDLILAGGICALTKDNGGVSFEETSIGIIDHKIHSISQGLENKFTAKKILNAKALHILPGVIDTQVHFRDPGLTHKEDLASGTLAAIAGGVTSVLEMPNTKPAITTRELFLQKCESTQNRIWCNIGFFIGATEKNKAELRSLENLYACCGIKIFMGSSTGDLLVANEDSIFEILSSTKGPIAVHAEDEELLAQKKKDFEGCHDVLQHANIRSEQVALKATQQITRLAEKAKRKVHILHVSSQEEMEFLRDRKQYITVETTPQFLLMSAPDCYEKLGTKAQMNPPIRSERHRLAVWHGLENGTVDVIGTDHAPHTLEEKALTYPNSPSGMPGVQTLVPLMLDLVNQKKLSLEKLVELLCHNPARIYSPKAKGHLRVGFDADITVVDLKKQKTIENRWIKSKVGWTPYDQIKVSAWPFASIIRGQIAMQEDEIIGNPKGSLIEFEQR